MTSFSGTQNPFEEYMSDSDNDESHPASRDAPRLIGVIGGAEEGVDPALTDDQLLLLSKLEMENKRLEEDRKAATNLSTSIPVGVNLARRASGTSLVSSNSATSNVVGLAEEGTSPELSVEAGTSTEEERWSLWGKVVNDWDSYRKRTAFVKALVRQGIPQPFRGLAWQLISGASDSGAKQLYSEYMKQSSPCEKLIRRDIARTYPDHDFFREKDGLGQESLFNVMKAYSLHDREVGYCQGSAFIVGLLLMQMPEEEAFAVLVQLMQRFQLRELFKPTMQELGLSMHQLDSLVLEQLPDLHAHFQQQNLHTTMYASSWFLTLFATSLPQDLATRVMDLILAEGTIFIFQMGMAILKMSALDLVTLDMELMIRYFQNEVPQKASLDDGLESLIQSALDVKIPAKKMKKWEKEYSQFKTKEDEEMVESRRLKTENKLLKQRIDHLEKESAALADRLIQGQVTRAQEAEDNFVLRREMSSLKKGETEAKEQLAKTKEELDLLKAKQIGKAGFESEASQMIKALQVELMAIRLKEAESDHNVKELEAKLEEAVEENRTLQEGPKMSIASLQDELTAVKLREAEANLSLKEMKEKVTDLEMQWKNYLNVVEGNSNLKEGSKAEKKEMIKMQEDLMVAKLNENAAVASAKDHRQRLMEMETQNQVLNHQLRRQDEEISRLKESAVSKSSVERSLRHQILEFRHRVSDLDSKVRWWENAAVEIASAALTPANPSTTDTDKAGCCEGTIVAGGPDPDDKLGAVARAVIEGAGLHRRGSGWRSKRKKRKESSADPNKRTDELTMTSTTDMDDDNDDEETDGMDYESGPGTPDLTFSIKLKGERIGAEGVGGSVGVEEAAKMETEKPSVEFESPWKDFAKHISVGEVAGVETKETEMEQREKETNGEENEVREEKRAREEKKGISGVEVKLGEVEKVENEEMEKENRNEEAILEDGPRASKMARKEYVENVAAAEQQQQEQPLPSTSLSTTESASQLSSLSADLDTAIATALPSPSISPPASIESPGEKSATLTTTSTGATTFARPSPPSSLSEKGREEVESKLENGDDDFLHVPDTNPDCVIASADEDDDDDDGNGDDGKKRLHFARAASVRFSHSMVNPSSPFSRASRGGWAKLKEGTTKANPTSATKAAAKAPASISATVPSDDPDPLPLVRVESNNNNDDDHDNKVAFVRKHGDSSRLTEEGSTGLVNPGGDGGSEKRAKSALPSESEEEWL